MTVWEGLNTAEKKLTILMLPVGDLVQSLAAMLDLEAVHSIVG